MKISVTADPSYKRIPRSDLHPFQGELKELQRDEYDKLKASIVQEGFFEPLEIWTDADGKHWIIDGHQRLFVCDKEGFDLDDDIPTRPMPAEDREHAARRLLALNSRFGRMTGQGLYEFMHSFEIDPSELDKFSLSDIDMDSFKLEYFEDNAAPPGDEDAVPEVPEDPTSKLGDLWLLGEHRVLCGDATSADDAARVMGDNLAALMNTDPPYGDSWVEKARDMHRLGYVHSQAVTSLAIKGDSQNIEDLEQFLADVWATALPLLNGNCSIYVWHGAKRLVFEKTLTDAGFLCHQSIIWLKPGFVLGRLNYHPQCEYALHGWRQGSGRGVFYGERNQSDVWKVDRENDAIHPTQKPIELFEKPISNHTKKGDWIYEPFAGSGSQIIAAEKTARRCGALEIEPQYVDVIVKRWQQYTGKDATLDGDGRTFNEIANGTR